MTHDGKLGSDCDGGGGGGNVTTSLIDEEEDDNGNTRRRFHMDDGGKKSSKLTFSHTAILLLLLAMIIVVLLLIVVVFLATRNVYQCQDWPIQGTNVSSVWEQCVNFSYVNNLCYPESKNCPQLPDTSTPQIRKPLRDIRLIMHFKPILYRLRLQTHIHDENPKNFYFNGSVRIFVKCFNSTKNFQIHSLELDVNITNIEIYHIPNYNINDNNAKRDLSLNIMEMLFDLQRQWLNITLNETMLQGEYYEIYFKQFQAPLTNTALIGLYLSSYLENGVERYLATSQMQPTDARRVFPCFDEPALKAKFQVNIVRHTNFHSISNMERVRTIKLNDIWYEDEHETSILMSTYLLGFVVSEFKNLTLYDSKNRRFSVWTRPDMIDSANYSLHIGVKILEYFETFFEMPYPLNKTDMVAVPDFQAGAMENWGVIIFRETAMLWDPEKSSEDVKQKVAIVVSHEIAHQWFGNLVTLEWWDDLWLNEGFASFVEYLGVDMVHPEWLMDEQFVATEMLAVMMVDSAPTTHPIQMPVYNPDEISMIFDYISYNKGASVIRMMEQFLGVKVFRKGLKSYLSKHQYDNTIYNDLWAVLREEASKMGNDIDLKGIMDGWIQQAGYPVVTVERVNNSSTLFFTQKPFLLKSDNNYNRTNESLWKIPITYAHQSTGGKNSNVTWMESRNYSFNIESLKANDWFIVNLRRAGFYRVNYDIQNWERLIDQLWRNHTAIPAIQRAALIDDMFSMAGQSLVNYTYFLRLGLYLKDETNFVAWHAASKFIGYMDAVLCTQPYYGLFLKYVKEIAEPIYNKLGWEIRESDDHLTKMLRPMIINLMCHLGHDKCSLEAMERFKEWKKNFSSIDVSGDLMSVIFCQGIKYGDHNDWRLLMTMITSLPSTETAPMLRSLGCSRDPWVIRKLIHMMMVEKRFTAAEASDVLAGILKNPLGEFIMWDDLLQYPVNASHAALAILGNSFHASVHLVKNRDQMNKVNEIRQNLKGASVPSSLRTLDSILENGKMNLYWLDQYGNTVSSWLTVLYSDF